MTAHSRWRFLVTADAPGPVSPIGQRDTLRSGAGPYHLELAHRQCSWGPRRLRLSGTIVAVVSIHDATSVLHQLVLWNLIVIYRQRHLHLTSDNAGQPSIRHLELHAISSPGPRSPGSHFQG